MAEISNGMYLYVYILFNKITYQIIQLLHLVITPGHQAIHDGLKL